MQKNTGYNTIATMAKMKKKDITSMGVYEIFTDFERKITKRFEEIEILLEKIYTKLEDLEKKECDFWLQYPWVSH